MFGGIAGYNRYAGFHLAEYVGLAVLIIQFPQPVVKFAVSLSYRDVHHNGFDGDPADLVTVRANNLAVLRSLHNATMTIPATDCRTASFSTTLAG